MTVGTEVIGVHSTDSAPRPEVYETRRPATIAVSLMSTWILVASAARSSLVRAAIGPTEIRRGHAAREVALVLPGGRRIVVHAVAEGREPVGQDQHRCARDHTDAVAVARRRVPDAVALHDRSGGRLQADAQAGPSRNADGVGHVVVEDPGPRSVGADAEDVRDPRHRRARR